MGPNEICRVRRYFERKFGQFLIRECRRKPGKETIRALEKAFLCGWMECGKFLNRKYLGTIEENGGKKCSRQS